MLRTTSIERHNPTTGAVLLHPASLQLCAGDHAVLMGASGSGKSVLMRSLALLDPIDGGDIRFRGDLVVAADVPAYRSQVAYIAQRPGLFPGSVEDNLRLPFTLDQHRQRRFDRAAILTLLDAAGREALFLDKAARDLSGGELQLLNLLRVLQLAPAILLLDEPTSALDAAATAMVEAMVRNWSERKPEETATLWVTHDPAQAKRVGNRFLRMHGGRLEDLEHAPAAMVHDALGAQA